MGLHPNYSVSAFSGIGALDLAVKQCFPASRTVCYLENEATAITRLVARMESGHLDAAPVWTDIRTFRAADFARRLVYATGQGVDLVYGGFPCQDISNAGNGIGINGTRSGLFFDLIRAVRELRPRYLFLENVAALTVRGLDTVLGTLAEIGFDARWGCLRASDVGAPHGRDRWWCLAWDREQLAVADSGPIGHGKRNGSSEWNQSDATRSSTELADAEHGGRSRWTESNGRAQQSRLETPRRRDALGLHPSVGDPCRQSLAAGRCVGRDDGAQQPAAERAGEPLGHAERTERWTRDVGRGRGGERLNGQGEAAGRPGQSSPSLPAWPPGPADRDGWAAILERWSHLAPAVEPGIRRVADGFAPGVDVPLCACHRGDRLRGLGNSVVPACAEAALRLLWWDAFGEWL